MEQKLNFDYALFLRGGGDGGGGGVAQVEFKYQRINVMRSWEITLKQQSTLLYVCSLYVERLLVEFNAAAAAAVAVHDAVAVAPCLFLISTMENSICIFYTENFNCLKHHQSLEN